MSRKIGLGDVHFDPDIDGEIDYDFFGDNCVVDGRRVSSTTTTTSSNNLGVTTTDDRSREMSHFDSMSVSYAPLLVNKSEPIDINSEKRKFRSLMEGNDTEKRTEKELDALLGDDNDDDYNHHHHYHRENGSKTFDISHRDGLLSFSYRETSEKEKKEEDIGCIGAENGLSPVFASSSSSVGVSSRDLLRIAATERFSASLVSAGSPISSDSGSDSASDLFSSTDDSFEDYDDQEEDSGSEITDVSPLSSANMSPLPESPKRTPEPKNNQNNFSSKFGFKGIPRLQSRKELSKLQLQASKMEDSSETDATTVTKNDDTVDLKLLTKAIFELEEERKRNLPHSPSNSSSSSSFDKNGVGSRVLYGRSRKNMTFTNDEVRRIEQENKRLLQRIIDSQKPKKATTTTRPATVGKVASSAVNRIRELKKIEVENLAMLKRLHAAKPTKELSREYLLGTSPRNGSLSVSGSKGSCSVTSSRTSGSFQSSNVPRDMAAVGRTGGRSHSTGSISSPSGSCSTSSSAFSNRSRSLKLPGGFLSHGQEARSGR